MTSCLGPRELVVVIGALLLSYVQFFATPWTVAPWGSSVHGDSPGKNIGVVCHALLQGILPVQGSNPGLPHCRQILYHLSHLGSPSILEWVAYPFSRRTSWPRNQTRVSCTAGRFFTSWAVREALTHLVDTQILAEWINELELLMKLIHSSISRAI